MDFYEKGQVRIRFDETRSGFPLLLIAGGGLNSVMTPVLVLPDDVPSHSYAVAMECAMLAPKGSFLRAHRPASA